MADTAVSIVIGSHNPGKAMELCLEALVAQGGISAAEIIVADSSRDGTDEMIGERFPTVRLLHFEAPLTVPELRGHGIAAAGGEIVAILDPYSVVESGWLTAVMEAHRRYANWIIGGLVDLYVPSERTLVDWAVYINEYGMFMPPMDSAEMEILPGSNITYKRQALFDGERPRWPVFWKTFANWEAEAAGSALRLAPEMVVRLYKPVSFGDFLRTRFHHGRCFAGMRGSQGSSRERVFRAVTGPLIPFILLWRWGGRYWLKKRHREKFLLTMPLQLLLFGNWALGEMAGYLWGAGKSCDMLFY
jgi:glycosyltransferase involved in cell wall biosynthesis